MKLVREPSLPGGIVMLLIAAATLWYSGLGQDAAQKRYRRAASMPLADYVVDGQREVVVGSGKSRHTEYLLALSLHQPQPAAPPATELQVARRVYEHSHAGDHWVARLDNGEPLFDPDLAGVERAKRLWLRVMALVFGLVGAIHLVGARRKR